MGQLARPVGKSYASKVDAEKIAFSVLSYKIAKHLCNWRVELHCGSFQLLVEQFSKIRLLFFAVVFAIL